MWPAEEEENWLLEPEPEPEPIAALNTSQEVGRWREVAEPDESDDHLAQLTAMGYDGEQAATALKICDN